MPTTRTDLLRDRRFALLLGARTLSMLALAFAPVALAFGVLDLPRATPTTLSTVLASEFTALVIFTLVGGVVADKYPRHRVLQLAEWTAAVVHLALGLMLLTHHAPLWALCSAAFLAGIGSAMVWPALTGIVPQVVPDHRLQDGNALLGLSGSTSRIVGLVSGGIVVVAVGGGWALIGAGAAFAVAGLLVGRLDLGDVSSGQSAEPSAWAQLRDGWDEFRSHTWLWVVVLQFSFTVMVWQGAHLVLGPVIAKQELGGAAAWTTLLTAESVGLVAGGLLAMRLRPRFPIRLAVLLSLAGAGPYLLLGLRAPMLVLIGAFVLLGACFEIFTVLWQTTLQREVPPAALSRVSSYDALGSLALGPVGLLLTGPAAQRWGPHGPLLVCGAVMALAAIAAFSVPAVRRLRSAPAGAPAEASWT